jgi:hypothetical protein
MSFPWMLLFLLYPRMMDVTHIMNDRELKYLYNEYLKTMISGPLVSFPKI